MKKKKVFKIIGLIGIVGLVIGGAVGLYLFNMPHRNIQEASSDYRLTVGQIASEYLTDKLVSTKSQIKFFSSTTAEDIEANNTDAVSVITKSTGEVVFSLPLQGFEFEKSLMQKHFNNDKLLDTKTDPKGELIAQITNLSEVDFSQDGTSQSKVDGELTINGLTKPVKESGTLIVKGNSVELKSKFTVTLSDYEFGFVKGKPSSNIAKTSGFHTVAQLLEVEQRVAGK